VSEGMWSQWLLHSQSRPHEPRRIDEHGMGRAVLTLSRLRRADSAGFIQSAAACHQARQFGVTVGRIPHRGSDLTACGPCDCCTTCYSTRTRVWIGSTAAAARGEAEAERRPRVGSPCHRASCARTSMASSPTHVARWIHPRAVLKGGWTSVGERWMSCMSQQRRTISHSDPIPIDPLPNAAATAQARCTHGQHGTEQPRGRNREQRRGRGEEREGGREVQGEENGQARCISPRDAAAWLLIAIQSTPHLSFTRSSSFILNLR